MKEASEILEDMKEYYPFTAVMGHERLKKLLFLCVTNRNLGTILIHGPKNTMKNRLIDSSMKLVQGFSSGGVSKSVFINHFDQDRLRDRMKKNLRKYGLDHIIIRDAENYYVDDIEDALEIWVNSKKKPNIILIENTNSSEGPSKFSSIDVIDFHSNSKTIQDIERRIEIIKREKIYRDDPRSMINRYEKGEVELIKRILEGRRLLPDIEISPSLVNYIDNEFINENPITTGKYAIINYAKTEAAFNGRRWVSKEDIDESLHYIR